VIRRYEVVYIFDAALDEAAVNERLARFHTQLPGITPQVSHWGKRQMAYAIKRHETGYYVAEQFEADGKVLPEFERAIKLEEGVVRHLIVHLEGEMPKAVPAETAASSEEDDE